MITVPAFFDETRRKATQDAGRLARLEVLHIPVEGRGVTNEFVRQLAEEIEDA